MPTQKIASPKPISSRDVAWVEWSEIPRFSVRYRHLTRAAIGDDYRVGVAIEELGPGKQSSPAHYHIFEEKHVYILEGALTVRIGDEKYDMKAGDYVCFPAGQKAGHCLINNSEAICRYVIVGERNRNEVAVYTASNKVLVRALGARSIFDLAATHGYWDGIPAFQKVKFRRPTLCAPRPRRRLSPTTREGTRFGGRAKHLTYAAVGENYHVGMLIEAPAPGMRLAPLHYHMGEEEHALILEGEVALLLGDVRYDMRAGDYVCFPAGQKVGHSLMNSGTGPCSYLMIGERNLSDVCVYPQSNKMMVRALYDANDIFDMSGVRRYWDGEPTS